MLDESTRSCSRDPSPPTRGPQPVLSAQALRWQSARCPSNPASIRAVEIEGGVRRMAYIPMGMAFGPRATLHVETNGVNSAACGALANPCRTITQAILNARTYDWILVGPGRYGNLDLDETVGEPGEEGRDQLFWDAWSASINGSRSYRSVAPPKRLSTRAMHGPSPTCLRPSREYASLLMERHSGHPVTGSRLRVLAARPASKWGTSPVSGLPAISLAATLWG